MTREDIKNIIELICPNDADYERPIISPKYLKQELEQMALEQEPASGRGLHLSQRFKDWQFIQGEEHKEQDDDLIGRQAVLDELNKWEWQELYLPIHFKENIIDVVPSVNPQKPMCRDCVSRDYLLSLANKDGAYGYVSAYEIINAPSVNPQEPKTGHWIVHPKGGIFTQLICDKCLLSAPYERRTNYCPNCGAKMESEDKG